MEITTRYETSPKPVTVLQLDGDLTAAEPLESTARQAFAEGARDIVLDMSKVNFISSSGLRAIHSIYTLLRNADAEDAETAARGIARGTYKSPHLKLVRPGRHGMKALSTAGYDIFLDFHDNAKSAVASFG